LGYRLACALCNRILAERPEEAHAIHLPGLIAYQSGNLGDAIEQLPRAVELAPAAPLFRTNLGEICRLAGRADEAVAQARRALGLNPKNPGALNNLGIALYKRREYQEALGMLRARHRARARFRPQQSWQRFARLATLARRGGRLSSCDRA
jgi:Flp pilus assembly protein TadD